MTVQETLARYMGYEHCVLFPCARDAMLAYPGVIHLPENICPEVYHAVEHVRNVHPIDQQTGLADIPTHLYGYQAKNSNEDDLAIDPLMTGWIRPLKAKSAIISFGRKKLLSLNYGGAFLTRDARLAVHMDSFAHWNGSFTAILMNAIPNLYETINRRFETIDLWDRHLGDSLRRVEKEQIIPWRVMRLADNWGDREEIVDALREEHLFVGTNFQSVTGSNDWGSRVLNFPCGANVPIEHIARTCEIIKRVLHEQSR